MSMPTFPESGLDITEDQALNMILASIAMEELALSHIMNAEGEKLQYILGTLPGKHDCCHCASSAELLEVNRSVASLLDVVMNNQLLLKGKLERVLEAKRVCRPDIPPHPCPPGKKPECGCCHNGGPATLRLTQANSCCTWKCESRFRWKEDKLGCDAGPKSPCGIPGPSLSDQDDSIILLPPQQTFSIHFAFRFQNYETPAVMISMDYMEECSNRHVLCSDCKGKTLTGQTVLTTPPQKWSRLCMTLHCPDCVCVENASLLIVPMDCA